MEMQIRAVVSGWTVGELVRSNVRTLTVLADAGITPRYASWTVADAAVDCGVSMDSLLARLERVMAIRPASAA